MIAMNVVDGLVRDPIKGFMTWLAKVLNKASGGKLTPSQVTLFGAVMHVPIALLIASRHNIWAAVLLVIFGLFDALDGALARVQNRVSAQGMLLDSVTDRMKEIMLYSGLAYAIISDTGRPYLAVWAVVACGCSLLTSYINAWGDAVMAKFKIEKHSANRAFRGGLMPFEIRIFVLFVGLLTDRLALTAIVIAIGAGYTALSRLVRVFGKLREADV